MIPMTLAEIADVGGRHVVDGDPAVTGHRARRSSTAASPSAGGLFVAVAGEHVDGHDYADAAVAAGAAAVLATRPPACRRSSSPTPSAALGALARHVLAPARDADAWSALTGSQGKTSTKDLLAQVLAAAGPDGRDVGSFNNELGLPLTVLRADAATRYLVLEMGARGVGHIADLCEIAPPDVVAGAQRRQGAHRRVRLARRASRRPRARSSRR